MGVKGEDRVVVVSCEPWCFAYAVFFKREHNYNWVGNDMIQLKFSPSFNLCN